MANNAQGQYPIIDWEKATDNDQNKLISANRNKIIDCTGPGCLGTDSDDFGITVWLYQNTAFTVWSDLREASDDRTEDEKTYIDNQSDYTIAIECNITSIDENLTDGGKSNFGCCLQD